MVSRINTYILLYELEEPIEPYGFEDGLSHVGFGTLSVEMMDEHIPQAQTVGTPKHGQKQG